MSDCGCDRPRGTWRAEPILTAPYGVRLVFDGAHSASEDFRLADAPALVKALVRRGDTLAARIVVDCWFVALCHAHGHTGHVMDGGG